MREKEQEALGRLTACGLRPSVQRMVIMEYLLTHNVHPTVEDVFKGVQRRLPTLSRTTVYNTLRLLAEHGAAQMLTIDERRVCYDGIAQPHVHFYCNHCGRIIDLMEVAPPDIAPGQTVGGHCVSQAQLYFKGVCQHCMAAEAKSE